MGCKGPISQNVRPYPEMNLQFQAPWVGKLQSCPPKSSYGHGVNSCRVIRARFSRIECETYAQGNFMDCAGSISQMFDPTLGKPSISSSWVARRTMILPSQTHPMDMEWNTYRVFPPSLHNYATRWHSWTALDQYLIFLTLPLDTKTMILHNST